MFIITGKRKSDDRTYYLTYTRGGYLWSEDINDAIFYETKQKCIDILSSDIFVKAYVMYNGYTYPPHMLNELSAKGETRSSIEISITQVNLENITTHEYSCNILTPSGELYNEKQS